MLDWQMELQMPHDYVRFMQVFGLLFDNDECEVPIDETLNRRLTKYVNVFVDLSFYIQEQVLYSAL